MEGNNCFPPRKKRPVMQTSSQIRQSILSMLIALPIAAFVVWAPQGLLYIAG